MANKGPNIDPAVLTKSGRAEAAFFRDWEPGSGQVTLLQRGVVIDVIYDLAVFDEQDGEDYREYLEDFLGEKAAYLDWCPNNTLVVNMIDGGDGQSTAPILAVPLFSPHLMMPVKPGETVLLIDSVTQSMDPFKFWITRIPGPQYVDDLNFTHSDRTDMESPVAIDDPPKEPAFLNGQDTPGTYTLLLKKGDKEPKEAYDIIKEDALANKAVTLEPIARYKKSPGDLVLQGSNNTLICLGQDRGWSKDPKPVATAKTEKKSATGMSNSTPSESQQKKTEKGTIDLVAGRGFSDGTKPLTIKNSRSYDEVDKNPVLFKKASSGVTHNWQERPCEGDPDFIDDKSRVYISMKTDGDKNFDIGGPGYALAPGGEKAYVVLRSDHIRADARDGVKLSVGEDVITIEDKKVVLGTEGDIIIGEGNVKIHIGEAPSAHVFIGKGATEPLVFGDKEKTVLWKPLFAALKTFAAACQAGLWLPIVCIPAASALQTAIEALNQDPVIDSTRSQYADTK